jgi:hypothetical protein
VSGELNVHEDCINRVWSANSTRLFGREGRITHPAYQKLKCIFTGIARMEDAHLPGSLHTLLECGAEVRIVFNEEEREQGINRCGPLWGIRINR